MLNTTFTLKIVQYEKHILQKMRIGNLNKQESKFKLN